MKSTGSTDSNSIIGQFGVGFYSSFMVSDSVSVESISAATSSSSSNVWESDGTGTYKIKESTRSENIKSRGFHSFIHSLLSFVFIIIMIIFIIRFMYHNEIKR